NSARNGNDAQRRCHRATDTLRQRPHPNARRVGTYHARGVAGWQCSDRASATDTLTLSRTRKSPAARRGFLLDEMESTAAAKSARSTLSTSCQHILRTGRPELPSERLLVHARRIADAIARRP